MKKILSFFIVNSLLIALYSQTIPSQPSGWTDGSGGEISNLAELRWLSETSDAWDEAWVLTANINAADTRNWNIIGDDTLGFSPIGKDTANFTGRFQGNRHTIQNLYINRPDKNYLGLFGYCVNSYISNIYLKNTKIIGKDNIGSLAGYLSYTQIINVCSIDQNLNGNNLVGGILGQGNQCSINESFSKGMVSGKQWIGGFAGSSTSNVKNCFAADTVIGNVMVGGFIGFNAGTLSNAYFSGAVSGKLKVGGITGSNSGTISKTFFDTSLCSGIPSIGELNGPTDIDRISSSDLSNPNLFTGWNTVAIWKMTIVPDVFPSVSRLYLRKYLYAHDITLKEKIRFSVNIDQVSPLNTGDQVSLLATPKNGYKFDGWILGSDTVSSDSLYTFIYTADSSQTYTANVIENWSFDGGTGFISDPYKISTLKQLEYLSNVSSLWLKSYELTADIDASETEFWNKGKGFNPIGNSGNGGGLRANISFAGNFFGNKHIISNLHINRPNENYVGLFGFIANSGVIRDVGLEDIEITGRDYSAGIIGYSRYIAISNCYVKGMINGRYCVGSLVGASAIDYSTIYRCFAYGEVKGEANVGGLVGYSHGIDFDQCFSSVKVSSGSSAGGLIANNGQNGIVSNCFSTDTVTGNTGEVGGLIGTNSSSAISNSYSFGYTDGGVYTGGLIGTTDTDPVNVVYDIQTSKQLYGESTDSNNVKISPLLTNDFQNELSFPNWNFETIWKIETVENIDSRPRPYLQWMNIVRFETIGNGVIEGYASQHVPINRSTTTVEAFGNTGYYFVEWQNANGERISTNNSIQINNVNSDTVVYAVFDSNEYVINFLSLENGSIEGETRQFVKHGLKTSEVSAIGSNGFAFKDWQDSKGNILSHENPLSFTALENKTLYAIFGETVYVNFSSKVNGHIEGLLNQEVGLGGNSQEVFAVPDQGYEFKNWTDSLGNFVSSKNPLIIQNVVKDTHLVAVFAEKESSLIQTSDMAGIKIYPNPAQNELYIYVEKQAEVKLFTLSGQLVKEYKISGKADTETINITDLQEGIYIVRLMQQNNIFTKTLLINR